MTSFTLALPAPAAAPASRRAAAEDRVMHEKPDSRSGSAAGDDALLGLRDRITTRMGLVAAAVITPFALMHAFSGRMTLALVDLLAAAMLAGNAWSLFGRGRPLLPYPLLTTSLIGAVVASVLYIGSSALVWVFPASLYAYMALPRRQAHVACAVMTLGVAGVALLHMAPAMSLRFVVAAGLMLALLNVVLGVIGELQRALVAQAITDPLTGAFNRRHLHARLREVVDPGHHPRRPHALLAFDIDHFKAINDVHGHAAGDHVLQQVVTVVSARKRKGDLLFRVGGEEFVLLLVDITAEQAVGVAEEMRGRIEQAPMLPDQRVTASIGVCAQHGHADVDRWLKAADDAMYEAKRNGRNRVAVAS